MLDRSLLVANITTTNEIRLDYLMGFLLISKEIERCLSKVHLCCRFVTI